MYIFLAFTSLYYIFLDTLYFFVSEKEQFVKFVISSKAFTAMQENEEPQKCNGETRRLQ